MIHDGKRLRFAVPGKGRLREPAIELLKKAGYEFREKNRNLYATCTNADIIFFFVRADDIPVLVASDVIDVGITGSDLLVERQTDLDIILPLNFGRCRLCVAVKEDFTGKDPKTLSGLNIATSFPHITTRYFTEKKIDMHCIEMNGSVEIMVTLGLADAIVDIVETGDSLRDNNLKILADIGTYETVLVAGKKAVADPRIAQLKRRIEGILVAQRFSLLEFNIPENRLKEAESIAPGYESPTISKLDEEGWLSVKVMVEKQKAIETMDKLESVGATAILETEVKNCRL